MPSLANRHRQLDFNRHFCEEGDSEEDLPFEWGSDPLRKAGQIFEEDRFSSFLGNPTPTTQNAFRGHLPLFERFTSGSIPDHMGT
jgi:hypothetical protein